MKCNQCDSLWINGVFCHEHGCPNRNKIYNAEEKVWETPEPDEEAEYCDYDTDEEERYQDEQYEKELEREREEGYREQNNDAWIEQALFEHYENDLGDMD